MKLDQREEECRKLKDYKNIKDIENGVLYLSGERIDIESYYNGNIKKVEDENTNEIEFDGIF